MTSPSVLRSKAAKRGQAALTDNSPRTVAEQLARAAVLSSKAAQRGQAALTADNSPRAVADQLARAAVLRSKAAQRGQAARTPDNSPRAVADLLARAARDKHQGVHRPDSGFMDPFEFRPPQPRQPTLPEEFEPGEKAEGSLAGEICKNGLPRLPLEPLGAARVLSRRRWVELSAGIRDGAGAALPVVTDTLASLRKALRPEPVLASGANAEAGSLGHHFEHALSCELRRGGRVLAIAGVIALGWAGFVPLSGAVIVAGQLVLHSNVKKVQHPTGGVVDEILVRNGSKVNAGDTLARLDETQARTNLQVVARQLDEVRLRIARLNAERNGAAEPRWPSAAAADIDPLERDRLLESERDFFAARATARRSEQNLAQSRIVQLEKQIAGLEAQLQSNRRQMGITAGELKSVETLLQEKLVTIQRATGLQRDAARMEGLDGQIASQIAETGNKVHETRLQALQSEQSFRSEVIRELSEAEAKEGELIERKLAAEDQLKRTVIRAPSSGTIHELGIHTAGGVVSPAEVLMIVVPDGDALEIDARLQPEKIDQVRTGQSARIRLSAFNARTTPELNGTVDVVSADLVRDQQSGGYYDVRITLQQEEIRRLGDVQLTPGMPAEVFLQTESRTMLSYLLKPMTDQLSRMFRER